MILKFKFKQGLNHLTSLNGFKLGTVAPAHLSAPFPSLVSSPRSVTTRVAWRYCARAGVAAPPSAWEWAVPAPPPPFHSPWCQTGLPLPILSPLYFGVAAAEH
jgi:hypothetical protein